MDGARHTRRADRRRSRGRSPAAARDQGMAHTVGRLAAEVKELRGLLQDIRRDAYLCKRFLQVS